MEFYSANGIFFLDNVAEAHIIEPINAGLNNESKMPMRPSSCIQFLYILVQTKRPLLAEIGYPSVQFPWAADLVVSCGFIMIGHVTKFWLSTNRIPQSKPAPSKDSSPDLI